MEASVLNCVNPYDVNPISGAPAASSAQKKTTSDGSSVKLEMEEFSDLAPFLPDDSPKFTDELNTPIFERKGPFNFMVYENTCIDPPPDPFKFEHESIRTNNSSIPNHKSQTDFTNNSEIIVTASEANLLFTGSEQILIINENGTPIVSEDRFSAPMFKIEDTNSVVSVNSNENYSNVSSPSTILNQEMQQNHNLGIETPENSNSSFEMSPKTKIPKFKFDQKFQQTAVLNTPDVIDSVVDLESSFNILDYVNEKDITTVNIEDIQFEQSPTTSTVDEKPKRKRKPKRYDDDDEDYIPPAKTSSLKKSSHSDSDSDEEIYIKRGRPPRRTSSISSEHSDASKYRELRDKNNEASRKSRLKRKMKELSLQKEADELYEKNVKLKAQVEEYEKMVSNFRNNLFKLMLKK